MREYKAFYTGTIGFMKYWTVNSISPSNMAEIERLQWSEDCIREPGVMYRTGEKMRRKLQPNGRIYDRKLGMFEPAREVREIRPK